MCRHNCLQGTITKPTKKKPIIELEYLPITEQTYKSRRQVIQKIKGASIPS